MSEDIKGETATDLDERQTSNREWWTDNTMSYDWKQPIGGEPMSAAWFDESDARFLHAARLFTGATNPFAELMDLSKLQGKRVLEIGCGMGFHTELLLRAGAKLTSIDISPTSIDATRKRLAQKSLEGDVREMDALKLDFPDEEFDLVWAWGVIHHSSHTARVMRGVERILKPGGHFKLMVYHLDGMSSYATLARRWLGGFWKGGLIDEYLWKDADGFTARFYTRDGLRDVLLAFFDKVDLRIFGQDADVVPLPRQIRGPFLKAISTERQIELAGHRGSMIYADALKGDGITG